MERSNHELRTNDDVGNVIMGNELEKVIISKDDAESRISDWISEGKKFIWPELWGDWEEEVRFSARGIFRGSEIMQALYIMKRLEEGGDCRKLNEEIKNLYNDKRWKVFDKKWELFDESGFTSFNHLKNTPLADTRRLICLFAKRGVEFALEGQKCFNYKNENTKNRERKFIEDIMKRNEKIGRTNPELLDTLDGLDETK